MTGCLTARTLKGASMTSVLTDVTVDRTFFLLMDDAEVML